MKRLASLTLIAATMFVAHATLAAEGRIAEPTVVLDRQRIEETGVDSVPELLQHLAQTAFHRGRGYRPSGAQYAELRGVGHQFSKVLIMLPEKGAVSLLTRELLYTGITRAKESIVIQGSRATILKAAAEQVKRASGIIGRFLKD